jgi:hypothetical protein
MKKIKRGNFSSSSSFLQFQWAGVEAAKTEEEKHQKRAVEEILYPLWNEVEACEKSLDSMKKKKV